MKGFLLILILSFFEPLQCNKSNHFFVTRRDNKKAICIQPYKLYSYDPFPTFDLDKLQIPQDVGFKHWEDWLSDWQLQNYTNVRSKSGKRVLIAGNHPFHFMARNDDDEIKNIHAIYVDILASNITLWMVRKNRARRAGGLLFELDHSNETTNLKDTTLKYCDQNPEVEGANCTIVDYKNGTNFLNDGNHWTPFRIKLKANRTAVEMLEYSYRNYKPVVQWTWTNANNSNPFTDDDFEVFATSHQRNAALSPFFVSDSYPDLSNNKEMKRNYTKRSSGKFCVWVNRNNYRSTDSNELMEVKNLASGRVQPATKTTHIKDFTYFLWNHLAAGEYEFTLRLDNRQPYYGIDLCQKTLAHRLRRRG